MDGFTASTSTGSGARHDAELFQALTLSVRQGCADCRFPLPGQPLPDVHAARGDPGQDLRLHGLALLVGDELA
ncbi:hypothetical protein ACGFWD_40500 [Streptomyces sp. NPDC048448]|uniref:hypothetical protein n=1 Tax=unclassified Streptomyces TaxID=2593676 RepID=UPI002E34F448|nr:hypothetical protein [Streptomyces sp. NBC_01462]